MKKEDRKWAIGFVVVMSMMNGYIMGAPSLLSMITMTIITLFVLLATDYFWVEQIFESRKGWR